MSLSHGVDAQALHVSDLYFADMPPDARGQAVLVTRAFHLVLHRLARED